MRFGTYTLIAVLGLGLGIAPVANGAPRPVHEGSAPNVLRVQQIIYGVLGGGKQSPVRDVNEDGKVDLLDYQAALYKTFEREPVNRIPDSDNENDDAVPTTRVKDSGLASKSLTSLILPFHEVFPAIGEPRADQALPLHPQRDHHSLTSAPNAPPFHG